MKRLVLLIGCIAAAAACATSVSPGRLPRGGYADTAATSFTVTIAGADTGNTKPAAADSLVYTGEAQALVTGGSVTVPDWPRHTSQPGDVLRELLTEMGAACRLDERGLTVTGGGRIHGIDADLSEVGELTPGIAALAALADGESVLRGVGHLRLHETDRLAALTKELGALGCDVSETADGLRIRPRPLHAGVFHTYDDHRLATAGAILGLAVEGVEVENIATTGKTLPDFPALWAGMLDSETPEGA